MHRKKEFLKELSTLCKEYGYSIKLTLRHLESNTVFQNMALEEATDEKIAGMDLERALVIIPKGLPLDPPSEEGEEGKVDGPETILDVSVDE